MCMYVFLCVYTYLRTYLSNLSICLPVLLSAFVCVYMSMYVHILGTYK